MLEIRDLSVRRGKVEVLGIPALKFAPAQSLAIVGPNGAGKSTLLQAIAGLLRHAGEIRLDDVELRHWPGRKIARRRAYLAQHFSLNAAFPVRDVVALGRSPYRTSRDQDQEIVKAALHAVGLEHLAERPYVCLSGGEQQRVHLARVLAQLNWGQTPPATGSRWALLDEPTASLDLGQRGAVLKACRALVAQGVGVIAVLHDLNLAWRYFDQVCLLDRGHINAFGTPDEVFTADRLQSVYATRLTLVEDNHGRRWIMES